jgi:hypothetical protein
LQGQRQIASPGGKIDDRIWIPTRNNLGGALAPIKIAAATENVIG